MLRVTFSLSVLFIFFLFFLQLINRSWVYFIIVLHFAREKNLLWNNNFADPHARCLFGEKRTGPMCHISIPHSPAQECRNSWLPLTHMILPPSYAHTCIRIHICAYDALQETRSILFIGLLRTILAIIYDA